MTTGRPRIERRLLAGGALLVALVGFGSFLPRSPDHDLAFGVEEYRHLGVAAFAAASAAVLLLLAVPGFAGRVAGAFAAVGRRIPAGAGAAIVAVGFGAATFLLPNYTLSGDAGSVVLMAATQAVHPSNAATCWWFRLVDAALGTDPVMAIRLTSTLAGVLFAACAVGIGRECAPPGPRRTGIAAVLLLTGTAALFFGTIEVYPPLVALVALYLLLGLRWLNGRGRGIAPPLCLGIAFCFHGSAGLLLPTLGLLANRGRWWPIAWRRWFAFAGLFLLPVLLTAAGLWFGEWGGVPPESGTARYGTFLGTEGEGPVLPLVRTPENPRQPYAIFDLEHAAGVLNLSLLVAPVGLLLLLAGRRPRRDAGFRFVAVAALFLFLFPNFWNVSYTLRRDWDLFSSLGVPLALLGALAWFSRERPAASVVRVAALSLFLTFAFAVSNHVRPWARYGYCVQLRDSLESAVPIVAAKEAVGRAVARAAEEELPGPDGSGTRFRVELRERLFETLRDLRAMEKDGAAFAPERFEDELTDVLLGPPARLAPDVAAPVAAALAADLATAFRRAGEQGLKTPPPGPLAAIVVRGTLRRPEIEPLRPRIAGEETDLVLLDALDRTMALGTAYRRVREPPGFAVLASALAPRLEDLEVAGEKLPDAARWTDLLALTTAETILGPRAADLGLRWPRLDAAAADLDERAARLEPGREAEIERAEYVSDLPELPPEERNRLVIRYSRHGLAESPEDAAWLYMLGGALYLEGRREEAIDLYRRAVRAAPLAMSSRMNLAIALRDAGRSAEAIPILERGLRLDPWNSRAPWALVFLAELRQQRGDVEVAAALAREAIRLSDRARTGDAAGAIREQAEHLLDALGR